MKRFFTLKNGVKIPSIGFGTYLLPEGKACEILDGATDAGYRHIDTAAAYRNEEEIGKWFAASVIPREELFITGKLRNADRGYGTTIEGCERSLDYLGIEYFDLYLIHWPASSSRFENWKELNRSTWQALIDLVHAGKIRSIGVSNFYPHHLDCIIDMEIPPMVDQIEYHPGHLQKETISYCQDHGILVEAWSPLGRGSMLMNGVLAGIASNHGRSPAQICIRWCLQNGVIPLPKSSENERIRQNIDVYDFELSEDEMAEIDSLPDFGFSGLDPDDVNF